MIAYIIILVFITIQILGKIYLKQKRYYKKVVTLSSISLNIIMMVWLVIQYMFAYREYKVAEVDASINIVPDILLSIFGVFFLYMIYNILYVIFHSQENKF